MICEETDKYYLTEDFKKKFEIISEVISEYTPIKIKHKNCNKILEVVPSVLTREYDCPICKYLSKDSYEYNLNEIKKTYKIISNTCNQQDNESLREILVLHEVCGKKFTLNPYTYNKKSKCKFCVDIENQKIREAKFKEYLDTKLDSEFTLTSSYINAQTEIELLHKKCNMKFKTTSSAFKRSKKCPHCKKNKINTKTVREEILKEGLGEYELLSNYINSTTKITLKHKVCGHEYPVLREKFLKGRRCPKCAGKGVTAEIFAEEVFRAVGDEFKLIKGYTNVRTKIRVKHQKCKEEFEVYPSAFRKNYNCPTCNKAGHSQKDIEDKILELFGEEFELTSTYRNCKTPLNILHKTCGHTLNIKYTQFMNEVVCECGLPIHKYKRENPQLAEIKDIKFKKYVEYKTNGEYEVLGTFENNHKEIKMKHLKCGHIFEIPPDRFKKGKRCFKCPNKSKKTAKDYEKELYDAVGEEYTIITPYVSSKLPMKFKHTVCGCEFEHSPYFYKKIKNCPKCSSPNKKITTEEFKKELYGLVQEEYILKSEYVNNNVKLDLYHKNCGNIYSVRPKDFKGGYRCTHCAKNHLKSQDKFEEDFYRSLGSTYKLLSEYKGSDMKVEVLHKTCKKRYSAYPYNILKGSKCPRCSKFIKTTDDLKFELQNKYKNEFTVLSEYVNKKTEVLFKHNECGNEFKMIPKNLTRSGRCPKCKSSLGEIVVRKVLKTHNLDFDEQSKLHLGGKTLFVDFVVYKENLPFAYIEFDGEQHYKKPVSKFGGVDSFKQLQLNDKLKNTYAFNNNIQMIRIPYHEISNVDKIIEKEIIPKITLSKN